MCLWRYRGSRRQRVVGGDVVDTGSLGIRLSVPRSRATRAQVLFGNNETLQVHVKPEAPTDPILVRVLCRRQSDSDVLCSISTDTGVPQFQRDQSAKHLSSELVRGMDLQGEQNLSSNAVNADSWVPDYQMVQCMRCGERFNPFLRRHHCRACGALVCYSCSRHVVPLSTAGSSISVDFVSEASDSPQVRCQRVCFLCYQKARRPRARTPLPPSARCPRCVSVRTPAGRRPCGRSSVAHPSDPWGATWRPWFRWPPAAPRFCVLGPGDRPRRFVPPERAPLAPWSSLLRLRIPCGFAPWSRKCLVLSSLAEVSAFVSALVAGNSACEDRLPPPHCCGMCPHTSLRSLGCRCLASSAGCPSRLEV